MTSTTSPGGDAIPETEGSAPVGLAAAVLEAETRRQAERGVLEDRSRPSAVVLHDDELPGVGGAGLSLRQVLAAGGGTVTILSLINFADTFEREAVANLSPDIQRTFHLSDLGLGALFGLGALLMVLAAVPIGHLSDRVRRTSLAGVCAVVAGLGSVVTGLAHAVAQLIPARLAAGFGQTSVHGVHYSLLSDRYPVEGRSRIFSIHNLGDPLGGLLGPVAGGAIALWAGGSQGWRRAPLLIGGLTSLLGLAALRLREPARGRGERAAVLGEGEVDPPDPAGEPAVRFSSGVERLLTIRTVRFLFLSIAVLGFSTVGLTIYSNLILDRQYHLDALHRGVVNSALAIGDILGIPLGGVIGGRLFRANPARAILLVAVAMALSELLEIGAFYLPLAGFVVVGLASSIVGGGSFIPILTFIGAVVPPRLRGLGFALVGIYLVVFGGFLGAVFVGALSGQLGTRAALTLIVPPAALLGGGLAAHGARFVRRDLSQVVEEIREENDERRRMAAARAPDVPVLQVRNLDAGHGQVRVLFDVALEVRRGEVVALLGTNGAGKSTLLSVISGLAIPRRGVIRLEGRTITYLDAQQRVALGIVQVPGGRAIFPDLTVRENLLVGARSFIWDRERLRRRLDRARELFPALEERQGQRAGSLSGGEQQMLALAKGVLLEPRLLLIDELSLGLAPRATEDLLGVIARLRGEGVSMLIVEQSINVAAAIADRALFMERGEIRFEGPAATLLERDDLARAVFLGPPAA